MVVKRLFAGCLLVAFAVLALVGPASVAAQDATPVVECMAPELPPGEPTQMDEGSPVASPAAAEEDMAVAEAEEERTNIEGPARAEAVAMAQAGLDNILACLASGDYLKLAALMTPGFISDIAGSENPFDVPAAMEGAAPLEIVATGEPIGDQDHRIGLHLVYRGLFNGPGTLASERWYLVREGDIWKVDEIVAEAAPDSFLEGYTVVDVELVDFAFSLSMNEIPAGPTIFRMSNTSYTDQGHVGVIFTLMEGITAEQVIQMEQFPDDQTTGFFGAVFLEPGQTGDLIFESLEPGQYTMVCDVTTPDGVPHWQLGMVAQFDVV